MRSYRWPWLALALCGVAALAVTLWWADRPAGHRAGSVTVAVATRFDPALLASGLWVSGEPVLADSVPGHPALEVSFTESDPRTAEFLARLDEWNAAYVPLGVRLFARDWARHAAFADTAVAARFARRLALGFPVLACGRSTLVRAPEFTLYAPDGLAIARGEGLAALERAEPLLRRLLSGEEGAAREGERRGFPAFDNEGVAPAVTVALSPRELRHGPLAGAALGRVQVFTTQFRYQEEGARNVPAPVGRWIPTEDGLVAARGGAANFLAIRYHAGRAFVAASPPREGRARLWILRDERWLPAADLGADARSDERGGSYVDVTEPRLYEIARGDGGHVLKLSPSAAGLVLHALTFDDPAAEPPRP